MPLAALKQKALSPYAALAFDSLTHSLLKTKSYSLSTYKKFLNCTNTSDDTYTPLFVTWNIVINDEKNLRGCIGTFSDLEVEKGIKEYSLIAAFDDPRFSPITKNELSFLECSITLLQNFEKCMDPLDWELGKHGIKINFQYQDKRYNGTFLPEVAVEQRWSKVETIQNLIKKLGFYKSVNYQDLNIQVTRYQGLKSKISYIDYIDLRKEMDAI